MENLPEIDILSHIREISVKVSPGSEPGTVLWSTGPKHGRTFRQAIIDDQLDDARKGPIIEI